MPRVKKSAAADEPGEASHPVTPVKQPRKRGAKALQSSPATSSGASSVKTPRKRMPDNSETTPDDSAKKRKKIQSLKNQPLRLVPMASINEPHEKDLIFLFACIQNSDLANPNYRAVAEELGMTYMSASGRYNSIRTRIKKICDSFGLNSDENEDEHEPESKTKVKTELETGDEEDIEEPHVKDKLHKENLENNSSDASGSVDGDEDVN